jgi:outer membrane protein assembly factor BamB
MSQTFQQVTRAAVFIAFAMAAVEACADWPQFRGPRGDGTAEAADLPATWGGFGDAAWRVSIPGRGWSSPVVVGERIWLTAAETTALPTKLREQKLDQGLYRGFGEQFQAHSSVELMAVEVDSASGALMRTIELFTCEDPPPIHATNTYASPTPVTDGQRLYCHFGSLGTVCLEMASGRVLWHKRFIVDEVTGPGSSPLLAGERLIVPCDGADEQFVVALDKYTGETAWRAARPQIDSADARHRRAFSTPLLVEYAGSEQLIVPGAQWVVAYDPVTGNERWRVNFSDGHATVPRPVFAEGLVFVCTGFAKPQLWAIRVDGTGDVTETHVAWKFDRQVPEVSSPVINDGLMYFVSSKGIATCLEAATGKQVWVHRLGGNYSASPLAADGKLYFTSEEGITTVLRPGRTFEQIARNELFGQTKASLAISGESLLLRTDPVLYCLRKAGAP